MSTRPPKGSRNKSKNFHLELVDVKPLTQNQRKVFESERNAVLNGCAGTGKSFIATYLGLKDIMEDNLYERLIYVRSAVSTRNIGFLPGKPDDKIEVYEQPYADIAAELFNRGDAYEILKQKQIVSFLATSFLRGTTLRDAVIIIDECQNMTYHELDSIITRVGQNCKVFICGDYFQSDLNSNGLKNFHKVLKEMDCFDYVEFTTDDIVRSGFVKEYLLKKYDVFGETHVK